MFLQGFGLYHTKFLRYIGLRGAVLARYWYIAEDFTQDFCIRVKKTVVLASFWL